MGGWEGGPERGRGGAFSFFSSAIGIEGTLKLDLDTGTGKMNKGEAINTDCLSTMISIDMAAMGEDKLEQLQTRFGEQVNIK